MGTELGLYVSVEICAHIGADPSYRSPSQGYLKFPKLECYRPEGFAACLDL